jgi:hypothetical protein
MIATLYKMIEGYTLSLTDDIDDLYAISNKEIATIHDLKILSEESCEQIFKDLNENKIKVDIEVEVIGKTKKLDMIKLTTYDKYPKLDHTGCLIIKPII